MKLGIFDSGLGGLLITKAIRHAMPDLDIVYLGDTLRLPYGNRSDEAIYRFTERAMRFLFDEQDCALVIIACNTASATALRRLQQEFLPEHYPDRNILGVIVPTLEVAIERNYKTLGVIGTNYTIHSNIYGEELTKLSPDIKIVQQAAPLLVPLIEHNEGQDWGEDILAHYLAPMKAAQVECLLLGCTHYPALKKRIKAFLGQEVDLISQDEIIPHKLAAYLEKHPEYESKIGKSGYEEFLVSDYTPNYQKSAEKIYNSPLKIKQIEL